MARNYRTSRHHTLLPRWLTALLIAALTALTLAAPATATGAMPTWQLPFENGQRWQAGAPHTSNGNNSGARGSLDFGPVSGASSHVVAVAAGTVYKVTCGANFYFGVDHGNGWQSTYYHMTNLQTGLIGQAVQAGTYLGDAGQALPCGGSTTFNHVHLTILKDGAPTPVDGFAFGNYTVHSTGSDYYGYWTDPTGATVITNTGAAQCCLLSTTQPINPDRDGDGVPDASDRCPDQAGPAATGGCPDVDGDGLGSLDDVCPTIPGSSAFLGCDDEYFDPINAVADANGDGKADYCRRVGDQINGHSIQCTLNTGTGFGVTYTSAPVDWGLDTGRAWVDANGDGKADYCRRVGDQINGHSIQCTLNTGTGFGVTYTSAPVDWGLDTGRAWVDANGDGKADYCRRVGDQINGHSIQCTLNTGTGFGVTYTSAPVDWGLDTGRAWVDANGDGKADYCRRVGDQINAHSIQCTLNTGTGFGVTYTSAPVDWGLDTGRAWVDANGDGKADYCRRVGDQINGHSIQCTLNTGTGFGVTYTSAPVDWGLDTGRAWVDANGDGKADYCRRVGDQINGHSIQCTLNTGTGFGVTYTSAPVDWGLDTGRAWVDANGDGKADYCRRVGDQINGHSIQCTLNTGTGFGVTYTSAPVDWGLDMGVTWAGSSIDRPVSPAAPARVDGCGSGKDTYTIPAVTGVEYLAGGVVKAPGTYPTSGATSLTITARAKPGYALTGTTTWTLTWTTTACTTTVTGNALSTPTWTLPKATLTWAATGAPAGTTLTYDVQFRAVTLSTTGTRLYSTPTTWYTHTTTKTGTISGSAGGVYQVQARTTDQYGTIGAWSPWTTVTMPIDDRATSFAYTGTWTAGNSTSYYGGTYKLTSTPAAKVTVTAWTDQVSVIGARSTTSGKATITIDGVLKATIDTYSATAVYRQTLATITVPYGKHTITITNLATTGRPRLILDALAFRR